MTPEQIFRATNSLWHCQLFQWAVEATFESDQFRKDMRKVTEAAAIIREYSQDMGTSERWNFVADVLHKQPREWKETWCKPDNYARWESFHG